MSVRATKSIIAELVVASGVSNSPTMIVQAVNEEEKTITAVWFSETGQFQQGVFPAGAIDRAEEKKVSASGGKKAAKKK